MRALCVVLALALALVGCGPSSEYAFVFEGNPADAPLVEAAAAEWNACGTVQVTIRYEGEGDAVIRRIDRAFPGLRESVYGRTSQGRTLIEYRVPTPDVQRNLAHEMGHAMGLDHSDRGGVMEAVSPFGAGPRHVTESDCDELRER